MGGEVCIAVLKIGDFEFPINDFISAVVHKRTSFASRASPTPRTDQQHPEQIAKSRPEAELAVEQLSDPTAGGTFRSELSVWRRPCSYKGNLGDVLLFSFSSSFSSSLSLSLSYSCSFNPSVLLHQHVTCCGLRQLPG